MTASEHGSSPIGQEADVGKTVVVVGADYQGKVRAVGIYESEHEARLAMHQGRLPGGLYWSLVTPAMNTCREIEIVPTTSTAGR